jgi:hypothetical protein
MTSESAEVLAEDFAADFAGDFVAGVRWDGVPGFAEAPCLTVTSTLGRALLVTGFGSAGMVSFPALRAAALSAFVGAAFRTGVPAFLPDAASVPSTPA